MPRFAPLTLKLAAVVAGMALAAAGLALAGVGLRNGPGHPSSSDNASDVHNVIDNTPPSERGCDFGHDVATAARGSELPSQAQAACDRGQRSAGHRSSSKRLRGRATPEVNSGAGRQFGQETADRAKTLGNATPEQRRQFGQDTAQGAQQLGAHPDQRPAAPQGAPATGETQSQAGRSTGEQASGGHAP